MINDLVSDMINRIRIAINSNLVFVLVFYSKIILSILNILKNEGYIKDFFLFFKKNKGYIFVYLKYFNNKSVIQVFKKISKPSSRVYSGYKNLPKIMNGLGILILSTSKGIITDNSARILNVGGELICYVF